MTTQIVEKSPLNLVLVREELEKIRKRDTELDLRGTKTDEYAKAFSSLTKKEADNLFAQITALNIPRFKEQYVHKLIDIMPVSAPQVKIVLQGYNVTISAENVKKLAETIAEFASKK